MVKLKTDSDLNKFLESTYLSINLFCKSLEYLRPNDQTFALEYGSYLYQLASFCSRQVKMAKLIPEHFSSALIEPKLREKQVEFLKLSLKVYQKASESSLLVANEKREEVRNDDTATITIDADSSCSVGGEKSSSQHQNEMGENGGSRSTRNQAIKTQASVSTADKNDEVWGEDWLNHYMLGKIKEKLNYPLIECLGHYKTSYDYLEKRVSVFLKRISYKSKSCDNLECNEVIYRIYALTLKRIVTFNTNEESMKRLCAFLESLIECKFVKAHDDLNLEQTATFLEREVFSRSKRIAVIPNKNIFVKCVTICIAGLNQILRRFSQHYRSIYRLAHFYSKFLDLRASLLRFFFSLKRK